MLGTEPSANWMGINRATYGARPEDLAQVEAMGWEGWVNDQLNVPAGDDAVTDQLLAEANGRDPIVFICVRR